MSIPNRTLCEVLEEMRKLNKTRNYASLASLIEEVQSLGNRMEAGLNDIADARSYVSSIKEIKKESRKLREKLESGDITLEEGMETFDSLLSQLGMRYF
jgi:hypothetical protein